MNDRIIELEEYKNAIRNKKDLDDKTVTLDELSLEEMEEVGVLYRDEISKLSKSIDALEEENKRLKLLLNK